LWTNSFGAGHHGFQGRARSISKAARSPPTRSNSSIPRIRLRSTSMAGSIRKPQYDPAPTILARLWVGNWRRRRPRFEMLGPSPNVIGPGTDLHALPRTACGFPGNRLAKGANRDHRRQHQYRPPAPPSLPGASIGRIPGQRPINHVPRAATNRFRTRPTCGHQRQASTGASYPQLRRPRLLLTNLTRPPNRGRDVQACFQLGRFISGAFGAARATVPGPGLKWNTNGPGWLMAHWAWFRTPNPPASPQRHKAVQQQRHATVRQRRDALRLVLSSSGRHEHLNCLRPAWEVSGRQSV